MTPDIEPLDLRQLRVLPLAERRSLTKADEILIDPRSTPPRLTSAEILRIAGCADAIRRARARGATVLLMYGAHLVRNGAARLLDELMAGGCITHLATNGAGTIHDWEYAWFGASTENVEMNVSTGTFGTWHETALHIHLALAVGAFGGLGYGRALGRYISEDGTTLSSGAELAAAISREPDHPLTGARFELLRMVHEQQLPAGRFSVPHAWKHASILASAWHHKVPLTVHPGIGYDIISNHPVFNGAVIGRAAELDFKLLGGSMANLDGGVVLSVGSAIMGPQVFEKSLSCVNNLRVQEGNPPIRDHSIYVVDLQDGGGWDWSKGEPPKTHPAYYLRFCKSFSRMGAPMHYLQVDNAAFIHHLHHRLTNA